MAFKKLLLLFFCIAAVAAVNAQKQVELIQANSLEGDVINGVKVQKVMGNVIFKHNDALTYCDSAYQYNAKNIIDAWGNVKVVIDDDINITGDSLNYNGTTSLGVMKGNVVLKQYDVITVYKMTDVFRYQLNPFRVLQ